MKKIYIAGCDGMPGEAFYKHFCETSYLRLLQKKHIFQKEQLLNSL